MPWSFLPSVSVCFTECFRVCHSHGVVVIPACDPADSGGVEPIVGEKTARCIHGGDLPPEEEGAAIGNGGGKVHVMGHTNDGQTTFPEFAERFGNPFPCGAVQSLCRLIQKELPRMGGKHLG